MPQLRILICRPDRIGDVVLSTHLPREIKAERPDSFVAMLVREETKDIFLNNPNVDAIITLNENGSPKRFWKLAKEIIGYKFTRAFMLLPDERINWILFFSLIPIRIGVGHKLYQFLSFSKYVDRMKYTENRHEADYCSDMLRKIGIETKSNNPEIFLSPEEIQQASDFRNSLHKGKRIIGVNSTSGGSTANLSVNEYQKLIIKLSKDENVQAVVTDYNVPQEIDELPGVLYPVRNTSLRKLIITIASLDVLISASTGPMHVAAALKIPTLPVFCPLPACSPELWGPLGNNSKIIFPEKDYCQIKCPGDPKKCKFEGEGGIDHTLILKALPEMLSALKV
ncbi:MAG: glycosyltransferase family 9 protein [Ignavibacteriales bacterium]|nr:MAG: glycosyltransferase family 9 protein [Ignavibacteriales bacterium]